MNTTVKGILYIILAIIVHQARQQVFILEPGTATYILLNIAAALAAVLLFVTGAKMIISSVFKKTSAPIPTSTKKENVPAYMLLLILGIAMTSSIVWFPNLMCGHLDYICGAGYTFIGMAAAPIGLLLVIISLKKLLKKFDKKLF